ncbi:Remorin [Capsicum annuum]|uniref:Remorin n=1 Tax=Capsicum annuum TaxID=4072 RepID=A0A2G2YJU4_CAPAN|nr:Remorin [Capsicum annuum]
MGRPGSDLVRTGLTGPKTKNKPARTITKAGVPPPVNQEPPLASVATPNDAVAPPPHETDISSKKVAKGSLDRGPKKSSLKLQHGRRPKEQSLKLKLKKVEYQLEHKIDEYAEKIKNEVALICKEADEKRAVVDARKGEELLKAEETAAKYRATGQTPKKQLLGCCGR